MGDSMKGSFTRYAVHGIWLQGRTPPSLVRLHNSRARHVGNAELQRKRT